MGQAMGPCELGNHPAVPDVQLTIQSCHTTNESIQLDSLFDPAKAAVFYNEKHVALMQERAQLQSAKHDFAVEESAKEAALQEKEADFEKEQEEKNAEILAKEVALASREQQCSFRCLKLSNTLRQIEEEEQRKKYQRVAGTRRLTALKTTLEKTQNKVNTKSFLKTVTDLEGAFDRRMAAKTAHRRKTIKLYPAGRTKSVPSICTPYRDFTPSKVDLVCDQNRNVITKEKAISNESKEVKPLDKELFDSILECEKKRLLGMLDTLETNGEQVSPVVVKRPGTQVDTLSKKCHTLSARRSQLTRSPQVSLNR